MNVVHIAHPKGQTEDAMVALPAVSALAHDVLELEMDDECGPGGIGSSCGLNALQMKANLSSCYYEGIFLAGKARRIRVCLQF